MSKLVCPSHVDIHISNVVVINYNIIIFKVIAALNFKKITMSELMSRHYFYCCDLPFQSLVFKVGRDTALLMYNCRPLE